LARDEGLAGVLDAEPQGQSIYQTDLAAKQQREAEEAAVAQQAEDEQLAATDAQQAGE
jgi:hypothetical protein